MDNAGYIALSRQTALFRQMEVVANNIANAETLGYKGDKMLFSEFLAGTTAQDENSFTSDVAMSRDMKEGPLRATGNAFDAALNGENAFFAVNTPLGVRYTRVGAFKINEQNELVNAQGYTVRGEGGAPIQLDDIDVSIDIRQNGSISTISPEGIVEERGVFEVVRFDNPRFLTKLPNAMFAAEDGVAPIPAHPFQDYTVSQGVLEGSNVNPISEMTTMISVSRSVGGTANFLSDMHDLQRRAMSTITRTSGN